MYVEGQQYNFSHPNRGNYKKTRLLNCLRFQLTRDQKESDRVYACVKVFFFSDKCLCHPNCIGVGVGQR